MRVGIIGRHASLLQKAVGLAAELGHTPSGTVEDGEALAWIDAGSIDALVVGGGVEPESRQRLLEACGRAGVAAHEVFGPANLAPTLRSL